jgi:hypothetical protein
MPLPSEVSRDELERAESAFRLIASLYVNIVRDPELEQQVGQSLLFISQSTDDSVPEDARQAATDAMGLWYHAVTNRLDLPDEAAPKDDAPIYTQEKGD